MFALVCAFAFAVFALVWVIVGDPRMAATIVITSFATVALIVVGFAMSHVSHRTAAPRQPDVIDVTPQTPQLPEPRWVPMSSTTLTRSDRLDNEARRVAQILRDADAPPTREAIKAHTDVQGHEACSMIVRRWAEWQWITRPTQGKAGEWIDE